MDNDDFDNVSWRNEPRNDDSRPQTSSSVRSPSDQHAGSRSRRRLSHGQPQAGQDADAVDLAGIGEYGRLDCTVGSPMKENDGTKDAYISYLVTTQVASPAPQSNQAISSRSPYADQLVERLCNFSKTLVRRPSSLYRLCFPLQNPLQTVSCQCYTSPTG